jgi:hypothetical protein
MPSSSKLPLALVCGAFILYAFGVLVGASNLTFQASIGAAVALVGFTWFAGRTAAPRVRWPLLAGVAALSVAIVQLNAPWLRDGIQEFARFDPDMVFVYWQHRAASRRWLGLGLLAAAVGGLVAVAALPHRRRRWPAAVAAVLALLVVGVAAEALVEALADAGSYLVALIGAVWAPTLAGILATATAALATQRGERGWQAAFAALGAGMLALVALGLAIDLAVALPAAPGANGVAFLSAGVQYSYSIAYTLIDIEASLTAVAMFAGPLLLVLATRPPSGTT